MLTFSVKYVWQWLLDNFRCTNIATNANQVSMHAALSSKTKCNMFLRIESLVHFKETMHSIAPFLKKNKIPTKHKPSEAVAILFSMNQYFSLQIIKIYIGIDKKNPILRRSSWPLQRNAIFWIIYIILNICIYNQLNEKQYLLFLIYFENFYMYTYYSQALRSNYYTKFHVPILFSSNY